MRRHTAADKEILAAPLASVMTRHPVCIRDDALAVEALKIFNQRNIDDLIVVNARAAAPAALGPRPLLAGRPRRAPGARRLDRDQDAATPRTRWLGAPRAFAQRPARRDRHPHAGGGGLQDAVTALWSELEAQTVKSLDTAERAELLRLLRR